MSKYGVFSGPNTGKYRPEKTPYLDTFSSSETYYFHSVFRNSLARICMRIHQLSCLEYIGHWSKYAAGTHLATIKKHINQKQPPELFCKKGLHANLAKFAVKHICQSLFLNKVSGLRTATLLKKKLWQRCFPVNYAKLFKSNFFIEQLWWLLLLIPTSLSFLVLSPCFN